MKISKLAKWGAAIGECHFLFVFDCCLSCLQLFGWVDGNWDSRNEAFKLANLTISSSLLFLPLLLGHRHHPPIVQVLLHRGLRRWPRRFFDQPLVLFKFLRHFLLFLLFFLLEAFLLLLQFLLLLSPPLLPLRIRARAATAWAGTTRWRWWGARSLLPFGFLAWVLWCSPLLIRACLSPLPRKSLTGSSTE